MAAFDTRNDREKARGYLTQLAANKIDEYLDFADEATIKDLFHRAEMIRACDRTPREKAAYAVAITAQMIFYGAWAAFALHLLGLL